MCGLRLKKHWDEQDGGLYLQHERRFTPLGYSSYWLAVDAAIQFWNKTFSEVLVKKQKKAQFHLNATRKSTEIPQRIQSTVHKVYRPQKHHLNFQHPRKHPSYCQNMPHPEMGWKKQRGHNNTRDYDRRTDRR